MIRFGVLVKVTLLCLLAATPDAGRAQPFAPGAAPLARVMLLGLFHFDNPGLDAVKYELDIAPDGTLLHRHRD